MGFFYLAGKASDPDLALEALDDPVHVGVIVQRYCLSLPAQQQCEKLRKKERKFIFSTTASIINHGLLEYCNIPRHEEEKISCPLGYKQ
jgi:hypothetical protein